MSNTVDWTRAVGDTGPPLATVLRELPVDGQRFGTPVDLTGTTVTAVVIRELDDAIVANPTATIGVDPGEVSIPCDPTMTTYPGLYSVRWTVVGTYTRAFPIRGADWLRITGDPTGNPSQVPAPSGATEIRTYNGTDYVPDPDAVIYLVDSGNPFPATNPGDLVIEKS